MTCVFVTFVYYKLTLTSALHMRTNSYIHNIEPEYRGTVQMIFPGVVGKTHTYTHTHTSVQCERALYVMFKVLFVRGEGEKTLSTPSTNVAR